MCVEGRLLLFLLLECDIAGRTRDVGLSIVYFMTVQKETATDCYKSNPHNWPFPWPPHDVFLPHHRYTTQLLPLAWAPLQQTLLAWRKTWGIGHDRAGLLCLGFNYHFTSSTWHLLGFSMCFCELPSSAPAPPASTHPNPHILHVPN